MILHKKITTLYNPGETDKKSLIDEFVVRNREFETIWEDIRTSKMEYPEQNYLIIGQRGMGKTTLLYRLKYAIEDDLDLKKWLLPISFPEEQYGIGDMANLWEYVAAYLEDEYPVFNGLVGTIESHMEDPDYERIGFSILIDSLKKAGKKSILLIDNFGDLLNKFTEIEGHRLREILMTCQHIRLVAGSSVVLEQTYSYDKPFYEFFYEIRLEGLGKEETQLLLRTLAKKTRKGNKVEPLRWQPVVEAVQTYAALIAPTEVQAKYAMGILLKCLNHMN